MNQAPLFIEDMCKYVVLYTNKTKAQKVEVWRTNNKWITSNYNELSDSRVEIIERVGKPKELYSTTGRSSK